MQGQHLKVSARTNQDALIFAKQSIFMTSCSHQNATIKMCHCKMYNVILLHFLQIESNEIKFSNPMIYMSERQAYKTTVVLPQCHLHMSQHQTWKFIWFPRRQQWGITFSPSFWSHCASWGKKKKKKRKCVHASGTLTYSGWAQITLPQLSDLKLHLLWCFMIEEVKIFFQENNYKVFCRPT